MADKNETAKTPSIEENIRSLQAILDHMENGDLTLEDALADFEKGVKLVKETNEALTAAENRIRVLTENGEVHDF